MQKISATVVTVVLVVVLGVIGFFAYKAFLAQPEGPKLDTQGKSGIEMMREQRAAGPPPGPPLPGTDRAGSGGRLEPPPARPR